MVANFREPSRKQVFTASNGNVVKNRVEKKKLEQILSKRFLFKPLFALVILHKL